VCRHSADRGVLTVADRDGPLGQRVTGQWAQEVGALWAAFEELDEAAFLARMDELAARLPPAIAAFERASAFDSTGHEHEAVSLYEQALQLGLEPPRHRRAV